MLFKKASLVPIESYSDLLGDYWFFLFMKTFSKTLGPIFAGSAATPLALSANKMRK